MYRQRRYRLKKRIKFIFMILLAIALLTGGGLWAAGFLDDALYEAGLTGLPPKPESFKGRLNVLVLGMDTREGETVARADTIMLCSVDTEKNIMSILSIPRDTRVNIPGHGWEKLNSSTVFGGPGLAMKLVSDLLGHRVNNYVMVDYDGFKAIVDALGGVTVDVKKEMYHHDPDYGGKYTIDIKPGVQRLNGEKALQYVRYRDYALGDIDRAEQQQKFLSALIREALQPSTVVRLPGLIVSTYKAVNTNLSLPEMRRLAVAAAKMTNANLITQTLPGKFLMMDGVSYWEPDPHLTRQVMTAIFEGRTLSRVVMGETTVVTTDGSGSAGQKETAGKVVPGQTGGAQDQRTGAGTPTGSSAKTGSPGQALPGSGTGDGKKQPAGSAGGTGKVEIKPGQAGSGVTPSGGIIPPGESRQGKDPAKNENSDATVIIIPKTMAN